jgi:AraC family ethanolamine operon transcriptional activator
LLAGLEEGDTIALLAARYGFWHAGQFSADYKGLFGESPSATLARAGQ